MAYLQHASGVVFDARWVVRNENLNHDNAIVNLLAHLTTSMLPASDTRGQTRDGQWQARINGSNKRGLAAVRKIVGRR